MKTQRESAETPQVDIAYWVFGPDVTVQHEASGFLNMDPVPIAFSVTKIDESATDIDEWIQDCILGAFQSAEVQKLYRNYCVGRSAFTILLAERNEGLLNSQPLVEVWRNTHGMTVKQIQIEQLKLEKAFDKQFRVVKKSQKKLRGEGRLKPSSPSKGSRKLSSKNEKRVAATKKGANKVRKPSTVKTKPKK